MPRQIHNPNTVFIIAGEQSGDLHGANLIRALRSLQPNLEIVGLGGEQMKAAGCRVLYNLARHGVMGFSEVINKGRSLLRIYRGTVRYIHENPPGCIVCIDFPDFNLRIARHAQRLNVPVVYYISPQVWAWRAGRIRELGRLVSRMLVILPFETELYRSIGLPTEFVGHPLLDHISAVKLDQGWMRSLRDVLGERPIVALLPGSRKHEIERLLPPMLETARRVRAQLPGTAFVIALPDSYIAKIAASITGRLKDEGIVTAVGKTYESLSLSSCAVVASGTATLETACFLKPMAVIYRVSWLSYLLARLVVNVPYISLVNILAKRKVVSEFVQSDVKPAALSAEVVRLLTDEAYRSSQIASLEAVRSSLGTPGASLKAAHAIIETLDKFYPSSKIEKAPCQTTPERV